MPATPKWLGNEKVWVSCDNRNEVPTVYVNAYLLLTYTSSRTNVSVLEIQNIKEVLYFAITRPQHIFNLVIDMQNTKLSNIDRQFLLYIAHELKNDRVLDDTLNTCTIINSNTAVDTLYDMISLLLDKETKRKIHIVKD